MPHHPKLSPVLISAPFGNYYQPFGATPTLGTFTLESRGGWLYRLWRMALTLRYHPRPQAWSNRLGLPNPGINWLIQRVQQRKLSVHDKVISVHGFNYKEWVPLMMSASGLRPAAVELNMSCPNVVSTHDYRDVFGMAWTIEHRDEMPMIVKLPPNRPEVAALAYQYGLRIFHCFNSLPTPGGGLSGKPLLSIYPMLVGQLRVKYPDITIIAGGGISCSSDMVSYYDAGADHVSVGSMLLHYGVRQELRAWLDWRYSGEVTLQEMLRV